MIKDNNSMQDLEIIERLVEVLSCGRRGDIQALKESVSDYGINPDQVLERGERLFSAFFNRQKLLQARNRLNRMRTIVAQINSDVFNSIQDIHKGLAHALSGETSGERYLAYHRKLESIGPKDLQSLDDDAALLEFLDKIDEVEDKNE